MKYRILIPLQTKNNYIFNNNCIQIVKHHKDEYELHTSDDVLLQKVSENGDPVFDSGKAPRESDVIYLIGNSIALLNKKGNIRYFHTIKMEDETHEETEKASDNRRKRKNLPG